MKNLLSSLFLLIFSASQVDADTTIELVSDPGDYIGQGQSYSYDDNNASITYSRNYDNGITVSINNLPGDPSLLWTFNLAAPGNAEIQPGVYEGAERFPFQGIENPGLSFTGNGRGCNTLEGSFEVYDVTYDGGGDVTALSVSFEQHCGGNVPALRGTIVFNTVPPVGVSTIGMAPYEVVCKNRTTGQRIEQSVSTTIVDCRKLGLDIQSGDIVQIRIRGIAE
ncbi:MAG: hypothetical protein GY820_33575 [Gammaproteobacteria bacterium]|nr:hypothetical protein [Gammaproteobacteria bacterium]